MELDSVPFCHERQGPLIGARADRTDRADDRDAAGHGGPQGRPQAGLDDAHDWHVDRSPQPLEAGRGRGVARHHDQLGVVFADQLGGDLPGKGPHLVQRPRAVGIAAGVADVDEVLLREQVDDSPGYRQTAKSAVKHADRTDVHGERSLAMPSPAPEHSQALRVGCKQAPTCRRGAREGSGPVEVNRLRPRPATGARSR